MNTNMIISIVYMVALFAIFYFLFIRPQRKKEKQLEELRSSLEVGQMVTTIGGMLATVAKVEEEFVVLEVGPNRTKMPFKKWAIASVEEKKENKYFVILNLPKEYIYFEGRFFYDKNHTHIKRFRICIYTNINSFINL